MPKAQLKNEHRELWNQPVSRLYAYSTVISILVMLLCLIASDRILGAMICMGIALLNYYLLSTRYVSLMLVLLAYTIIAPPDLLPVAWIFTNEIPYSHFRMLDLVLCAGLMTYVICFSRLATIAQYHREMYRDLSPQESITRSDSNGSVDDANTLLGKLLWQIAMIVVFGQVLWLGATRLRTNYLQWPPIRLSTNLSDTPGVSSRLVIVGGFFVGVILFLLIYTRLTRSLHQTRDEANLFLLDTLWNEHRRDLNRQARWRQWLFERKLKARNLSHQPKRPSKPRTKQSVIKALILTTIILLFSAILALVLAALITRWLYR